MSKRSAAETVSRILWAFIEEKNWSQTDLARRVDLTVRAVRLRLEELERGGMPLVRDDSEPPQVVWSVPKGWFPDGVALSKADLALVMRFIARSPQSTSRDVLMRKLLGKAPTGITANTAPQGDREAILTTLEDGRAAKRAVHLLYTTASTGIDSWRHASVQHIEYGPRTRFIVFCHRRQQLITFRVSGVREARLDASEPYVAVDDARVTALLRRSADGYADDAPAREVTFAVYGDDARWVQGNLPSAEMTVETCEGGIRVRTVTSGLTIVARFVVGLGASAVAETPELAERVEELARGALARAARRAGGAAAASGEGGAKSGVVKAWITGKPQEGDAEGVR